jgi:hypothetical protein
LKHDRRELRQDKQDLRTDRQRAQDKPRPPAR